MKNLIHIYIKSFKGLSREVWFLSLITLINRAGTMVIPFLSLYLTKEKGFTKSDAALVMICFGLGSVLGSYLGGKLTDRIGNYKVMTTSLFLTGLAFFMLQYMETLEGICLGVFAVMLVADTFRPALFVAVSAYSKPENKTRSITLIRLAINLGFSLGPALGGLLIAKAGYVGLFWVDAITCALAGVGLLYWLSPKRAKEIDEVIHDEPKSAWSDKTFLLFLISMSLFGFVFLQYFSTVPLFYAEVHGLSEFEIGLLFTLNGGLIFLMEMPMIQWLDASKTNKLRLILIGALLTAGSIAILNAGVIFSALVIGILLMTFGEMIAFPYSNTWTVERSKRGKMGEYMALFTVAFSVSHIFGHYTGLKLIEKMGYTFTWWVMTGLMLLCVGILWFIRYRESKATPAT